MMTIVSEDRFQGKAAVTLKKLRLGEEEEGWLMRFNKVRKTGGSSLGTFNIP